MITCIFACDKNGVIGIDGKIPWHYEADLKYFKTMTTNSTVIMGRNTFESIGCKPLPNRENIVITSKNYNIPDIKIAINLSDAIMKSNPENEIFIIGGANLLNLGFEVADRILCTKIHKTVDTSLAKTITKVNMNFLEYYTLKSITMGDDFDIWDMRNV